MGPCETQGPMREGRRTPPGEVTEWSKVHDWKSCVPKGTGGSNPFLSALWSCQRRPVKPARPGREQR